MAHRLRTFIKGAGCAFMISTAAFSFISCTQEDDPVPVENQEEDSGKQNQSGNENQDPAENPEEDSGKQNQSGNENQDPAVNPEEDSRKQNQSGNENQDPAVNPEQEPFKPYVIKGFYQKDTDPSDDSLKIEDLTLTDYSGVTYTILDDAVWSASKTEGLPLQVAYLVSDGEKKYLCSVWYYVNNGKDYVKWNPPEKSSLDACPEAYDYKSTDCNTGKLSSALKTDLTWTVSFSSESATVTVAKNPGHKPVVSCGGKEWTVSFQTCVKNMDLSMPAGEDRMEMEVEEGLWFASSENSPNLIHSDTRLIEYPLIDGYTAFYELQCCSSYGMYLLSVTKGNYNYDDEEEEEYIDYSILGNFTLTKEEYDSLMVHYR